MIVKERLVANPHLEIVSDGDTELAYIIRADWHPQQTEFLTPDDLPLQLGMIICGAGQEIKRHVHLPIVRNVHGTSEVLVVRRGSCDVDIYDADRNFISTHMLSQGTIILLLGGGHGFRMHEDTVLFEVKQGPYAGEVDKVRF